MHANMLRTGGHQDEDNKPSAATYGVNLTSAGDGIDASSSKWRSANATASAAQLASTAASLP